MPVFPFFFIYPPPFSFPTSLRLPNSLNSNFPKQYSHEQLSRRANSKLSCSTLPYYIIFRAIFLSSFTSFTLLIYHVIDSSSKFSFPFFVYCARRDRLFFFSTKRREIKKYRTKKKICPFSVCRSFKSSRNGVTSMHISSLYALSRDSF